MHRISDEQRRIRLGRRHLLSPSLRTASPVTVADAVVALHATDVATVFLSTCARLSEAGVVPVEQALYRDVSLVRQLAMRNTLFVVSRELAPCVDAANARTVAAKERRTFLKHLADDGNSLDVRWLADAAQQALAALADRGPATGTELSAAVAALRTKITVFPARGGCCPTSAGMLPPRRKRKHPGSRNGWVRHGSLRASVPRWKGS